jgi:cell division protein FtsA
MLGAHAAHAMRHPPAIQPKLLTPHSTDMQEKEPIIVAIELGTSHISGIAGKKKDGNLNILAYAEEKSEGCIKRGVIFNIEKTTKKVKSILDKLQTSLGLTISQVYVGIGGQSVRTVKNTVRRNLLTQSYITSEHIDSMQMESREINNPEYELIDNFQQGFIVDSNVTDEPVGVTGTNIEGDYVNVIARRKLRYNIENCFNNTNVRIVETKLEAYELAQNVLTDQEKRAGSALIDLGAGTSTVQVFWKNTLRYLVTLPLGTDVIIQDLVSTLRIEPDEAERILLQYGNASNDEEDMEENLPDTYQTSVNRVYRMSEVLHYIYARQKEILDNIENQLIKSGYSNQLLGGIVLTGGGSKIKHIEGAFQKMKFGVERIRVAHAINDHVIFPTSIRNPKLESGERLTILSLLKSGNVDCVGNVFNGNDMFEAQKNDEAAAVARAEKDASEKLEKEQVGIIEAYNDRLRSRITELKSLADSLREDLQNKKLRLRAERTISAGGDILDEATSHAVDALRGIDKHRMVTDVTTDLERQLTEVTDNLQTVCEDARKATSVSKRLMNWIERLAQD